MIPREILDQALADYEKAVAEIQGMGNWEAVYYLGNKCMGNGLCHYLEVKFDVDEESLEIVFGRGYLKNKPVLDHFSEQHIIILTHRLQLRINKLKELLEKWRT